MLVQSYDHILKFFIIKKLLHQRIINLSGWVYCHICENHFIKKKKNPFDVYHLTYFFKQNVISFVLPLPLIYAIFESSAGCPYSCVKRAPHAFSFASTGSARVFSQGWLILLFFHSLWACMLLEY